MDAKNKKNLSMEGHTADKVLRLSEGEEAGASLHVPEANLGKYF